MGMLALPLHSVLILDPSEQVAMLMQTSTSKSKVEHTMSKQILIIDSQVQDYQQLLIGIDPDFEVAILDPNQDGILQITHILHSYHSASAEKPISVYLLAHGAPGCLHLGNSQLSLETVESYTQPLKTWFPSHSPSPSSLHLYSCSVAAGDAGEEFLRKLHAITGAVLHASSTPIGYVDHTLNWQLSHSYPATSSTLSSVEQAPICFQVLATYTHSLSLSWDSTNTLSDSNGSFQYGLEINDNFLYVTDSGDNDIDIYAINSTTGALSYSTSFGSAGFGINQFNSPFDLDFLTTSGGQTKAYVMDALNARIVVLGVDPTTGALTWDASSTLSDPTHLTEAYGLEINGNFLYATDLEGGDIDIYAINSTTGALTYSTSFGSAGSDVNQFANPLDLAFLTTTGGQTKAYVMDSANNRLVVLNVDPATGDLTWDPTNTLTDLTNLTGAFGLEIYDDLLYVTDTDGSNIDIYSINLATGGLNYSSSYGSAGSGVDQFGSTNSIIDITFLPISPELVKAYVADSDNNRIVVLNVDDGTPNFTSNPNPSVQENTTTVITVAATDPDSNTITYSITGGVDKDLFSINTSTGQLSFINAPNFEVPADANGDNVYEVTVLADDGSESRAQSLQVSVTNINDNSPVFTSEAELSVVENSTIATTVVATDADGDELTYSMAGGADVALFTIDGSTGVLSFKTAPDFENPTAAGGGNIYEVIVSVNDGVTEVSQTIEITVTDGNDNPIINSTNEVSFSENGTGIVLTVDASDPENAPLTYSIIGGADFALFTIDDGTGELSFVNAPDFETPADADSDNIYEVQVAVSDGNEGTALQDVLITVTNINEAPEFTSANAVTVREGRTNVFTVAATDAEGDTLTYSISGGDDESFFSIDSATGTLRFATAPDFELPLDAGTNNVYEVEVTVDDGNEGLSTQSISITVEDVNNVTDFNNDDLPDIVWRNTSKGLTNIWFTDGSTKLDGGPAGDTIANPSWVTLGVGDFDHDGKRDDILWRNISNGSNVVWFMDGTNKVGNAPLPSVTNTAWEIQGVGDFDHSGHIDDILWRNQTTGQTTVWTMDGSTQTGIINFGVVGSAWRAQGVGDFEANGHIDDIVWRNYKTGQTLIWETDGAQRTDSVALSDIAPVTWEIEGVSDLDGDGVVDDLLWLNESNYKAVSWFIDNGAKTGNAVVSSAGGGWDAVI